MHLTTSRRAGKRVRGLTDLLPIVLMPPPPPTPPPRLDCARATCGQLIAVCVWGGGEYQLVTLGGGGGDGLGLAQNILHEKMTHYPLACGQLIAVCV